MAALGTVVNGFITGADRRRSGSIMVPALWRSRPCAKTHGRCAVPTNDGRLARFDAMREESLSGGGAERIQKQHAMGKITARERLELLLDAGSFTELDRYVVHRAT